MILSSPNASSVTENGKRFEEQVTLNAGGYNGILQILGIDFSWFPYIMVALVATFGTQQANWLDLCRYASVKVARSRLLRDVVFFRSSSRQCCDHVGIRPPVQVRLRRWMAIGVLSDGYGPMLPLWNSRIFKSERFQAFSVSSG